MRPFLLSALLLISCAKPSVFQEAINQGATRFFGKAKIDKQATSGNVTSYTFTTASGPECLTGEQFTASIRDTGSDDLFIFLQGGGACWSDFCLATTAAPPGIPQEVDIVNATLATNPVAKTNTVYLPYCDGSLFAGDADWSSTGSGAPDRFQHGLQNVSAALDVAFKKFPNPKRVILAGSSGGGYGTIMATILVRARYPDVPIRVFEDSGSGLGNPSDVTVINKILTQINALALLPKSCTDCIANGHITKLIDWELARDPQLQISLFSSYEDYVISQIYLKIDAGLFKTTLLAETGALHDKYPTRYKRFLTAGSMHTTLLGGTSGAIGLIGGDPSQVLLPDGFLSSGLNNIQLGGIDTTKINDVSIATWFKAMLDGSAGWSDTLQAQ